MISEDYAYGFNLKYKDIFRGQEDVLKDACDLNPLLIARKDRMRFKLELEDEEFDPERYAYDNYDDEQIEQIETLIDVKMPSVTDQ